MNVNVCVCLVCARVCLWCVCGWCVRVFVVCVVGVYVYQCRLKYVQDDHVSQHQQDDDLP